MSPHTLYLYVSRSYLLQVLSIFITHVVFSTVKIILQSYVLSFCLKQFREREAEMKTNEICLEDGRRMFCKEI